MPSLPQTKLVHTCAHIVHTNEYIHLVQETRAPQAADTTTILILEARHEGDHTGEMELSDKWQILWHPFISDFSRDCFIIAMLIC